MYEEENEETKWIRIFVWPCFNGVSVIVKKRVVTSIIIIFLCAIHFNDCISYLTNNEDDSEYYENILTRDCSDNQRKLIPMETGWRVSEGREGRPVSHNYSSKRSLKEEGFSNQTEGIKYFDSWEAADVFIPYEITQPIIDGDVIIAVQNDNNFFLVEYDCTMDKGKTFELCYTIYENDNWDYECKYNGDLISQNTYLNNNGYEFNVFRTSLDGEKHTYYAIAFPDMLCRLDFMGFEDQEEANIVDYFDFTKRGDKP